MCSSNQPELEPLRIPLSAGTSLRDVTKGADEGPGFGGGATEPGSSPKHAEDRGCEQNQFWLEAVNRRLNTLLPGDRGSFWQVSLESRISKKKCENGFEPLNQRFEGKKFFFLNFN